MRNRTVGTVLAVFVVFFGYCQVPQTLSYQGLLTDNTGAPVADGSFAVTFRFYSAASGGVASATRGPLTVTTFKGLFMITLGDGSTDNAALPFSFGNQELYVGLTVSPSTTELAPRVRLTAVPYAFVANTVTSVDATKIIGAVSLANGGTGGVTAAEARTNLALVPGTNVQAYNINLDDLADGSLTGSKVGTGIDATNITTGSLTLNGTDAAKLPVGTTAQRPASPLAGQIRYNTTEATMEYFNGTNWFFMVPKVAFLKDAKSANAPGGTNTINTWVTRDLNTLVGDNFVTLSANTFTLGAGEYTIEASAPAYQTDFHKIRLFDVSTGIDNANYYGSSEYNTSSGTGSMTDSKLMTRISITSSTTFRIEHYTTFLSTSDGFGSAGNLGLNEIYTQVKITKLR